MDLDTFFVSCERLLDSRLNGKPILIGGTSDRGVVASCSYEARSFGVSSAMPMKMARQLCPEAIIIKGNSSTYSKYSHLVTDIIKNEVPVFEKSSIDEFYLDMTGMDKFVGNYQLLKLLRKKIMSETGLPISFGLSKSKSVSKVATGEAKPDNEIKIDLGFEKSFLAPLSAKKLPMVGEKTYHTLCRLGLKKVGLIQETSADFMDKVLGKNGVSLWKKSNGEDNATVKPYSERKSISTERTFNNDTIDVHKLKGIILAMLENLAFQLRRANKLTACITVKIRYSDFNTVTMQAKIPYTSADYILYEKAQELFDRLYNKRLLIRLIGVRLSALVNGKHQMTLFDHQERKMQLYSAMDSLREKYGDRSVMCVAGMNAKTIGGTNPFNGSAPALLANRRI